MMQFQSLIDIVLGLMFLVNWKSEIIIRGINGILSLIFAAF